MKTKALILSLCAVVLVTTSIIGTIAYLTDQDEVVNTFTVGKVDITVNEEKVNPDGTPTIEDDDRVKGNEYHLIPGKTYVKDPTMTVIKGSEESYVRMLLTINNLSELDAIFAPDGVDLTTIFGGYDGTKWIYEGETENTADNTITYEFRYVSTVDATEATEDMVLEPLFDTFTLPGAINAEELKTISDLKITVVGHAIQAEGFADEDAAWVAFDVQVNE